MYVHSKVAIFDDNYAAIGSFNFGPRSVDSDGELTAFIHGPFVHPFAADLWGEYGMGAPGSWRKIGAAHLALAKAGKLTPGMLYALPIEITEYPKVPPTDAKKAKGTFRDSDTLFSKLLLLFKSYHYY